MDQYSKVRKHDDPRGLGQGQAGRAQRNETGMSFGICELGFMVVLLFPFQLPVSG
jgi:hypothetical protein